MNILVIHETEYVKKVVYEFQIIPELLASNGHRVFVIDYPMAWKKSNLFDLGSFKTEYYLNVKKANKKKGVTLIRPGIIKIPGISRLFAFFSYFSLIKKTIKKYKINQIILYSVPTNGLQTLYYAKKYKIPVHFRMLDVLHQLVPSKLLSWPTYLMEKYIYKRVTEITAITPRLVKYAIKMGGDPKTTSYLPTGSDADLFFPQKKNIDLIEKFWIKKQDNVVLFAGTLYNFSGLDILIKYLGENPKLKRNLKMIIVGHGEQEGLLKKMIKEYNLDKNVFLTGFIDYLELNTYINLADICINSFQKNNITNIIFPSKIYQYLACGKPVVATKLKGLLELFPVGNKNVYYFNLKKPGEFFYLIHKIKHQKINIKNQSLQKIMTVIEEKLEQVNRRVGN
ncbi:TPA: hypothetical protein DD449_03860 [Candidatus Berkelbacteria bacterium]|uniref:Group 1 glycosyl transferase n=1 Tax=Berkelbacteria bacterium GW2011_GWE1_39_12 TaxID=1618337 RepID=A0A0G4B307_9BACT|nr:MAG: group 1 glycosyl transferase [Berkelbacteria bacterium GW2011_GWE1_39_12]HBO60792.1 hypothetical protein [Candidatus Berkelbacteria bacterium]